MKQITIPALDGLRGLACLIVVLSHAGNMGLFFNIRGSGQLGVMLFYTLSGFLMAYLYSHVSSDAETWITYAVKRFFRVYPTYFVVLIISFLAFQNYQGHPYQITFEELLRHVTLRGKQSVFWTIPVEIEFYVVFPFVASVLSWIRNRHQKLLVAITLFIGTLLIQVKGSKISLWPYLEFFIAGVLAGYTFVFGNEHLFVRSRKIINGVFVVALAGIFVSIPRVFEYTFDFDHNMWKATYLAPLMAATVLCCALSTGSVNKVFSNRASRFLGKISFSLYLVHLPCLKVVKERLWYSAPLELAFGIVLCITISYLLFIAVENPVRNLGKKLAILCTNRLSTTMGST